MIPATKEQRLISLRQQLAVHSELAALIKAVSSDYTETLYERTHAQIDSSAHVNHTLGQAKGVQNFLQHITAEPTSSKRPR